MNKLYHLDKKYKGYCWDLLNKLFPIHRTILGEGYEQSLEIVNKIIPIKIREYSSGEKCGSWTIPDEWIVKSAFLKDKKGRVILDYQKNKFYLWQYSIPFNGKISRSDLIKHIKVEENEFISHTVTYYSKNWGFNISQKQYEKLNDEFYYVEIDTEFKKSTMKIGEFYLPGSKKEEIIIDSVLSCPSLANNLSGVSLAVYTGKLIRNIPKRNFSYRILFTPETIGPIALHFLNGGIGKNVVGGYNLVNLAYGDHYNYKKSRLGNTIADLAMEHSLNFYGKDYSIDDYNVTTGSCGNEKAYNSLGIEIPIGSFHKSPMGSYSEYDTDHDNLDFINKDMVFDSLKIIWGAIQTLERSETYKHKFEGEPFLTGYGLFTNIEKDSDRLPFDYLMGFANGKLSLVDIAKKARISIDKFDNAVSLMLEKGLIKRK